MSLLQLSSLRQGLLTHKIAAEAMARSKRSQPHCGCNPRFVADSLLEGTGFEPAVPREKASSFYADIRARASRRRQPFCERGRGVESATLRKFVRLSAGGRWMRTIVPVTEELPWARHLVSAHARPARRGTDPERDEKFESG